MNCPCSGVYVCAYIVIFLPWPAKNLGYSMDPFLCVLSAKIPISPERQKHSEDNMMRQTN